MIRKKNNKADYSYSPGSDIESDMTATGQRRGLRPLPKIVCVLGPSRSGTSLTTRILSLLGVELGGEEQMESRNQHNPKGFFEHRAIQAINEEIYDDCMGAAPDRKITPCVERKGRYWASPADDAGAVKEVRRLVAAGAEYIVFVWTSFWSLEYFHSLNSILGRKFSCAYQNERAILFDLRQRL